MKTCPKCGHRNEASASFCGACGTPLQQTGEVASVGAMETVAYRRTGPIRTEPLNNDLVLSKGDTFAGRYEIVDELGRGGMGVVYRAKEQLGSRTRDIALKLIRADRAADRRAVESLLSEGALIQEIGHPNVVKVYNVGEAQGRPFVAMKFVDGVTLREWHRRRFRAQNEVSLGAAAAIVRSILAGLGAAHAGGVIHRDLKPENIILTSEPSDTEAKLQILDFGIAREPDRETRSQTGGAGGMLGTIGYMAPEQKTYPESVRPSADLYSLSHIFYELLMDGGIEKTWQPPSGGRPDIPTAIDDLIEKGISTRPLSRPQSVEEYRLALDAALGAPGPKPAPPPIPTPRPTPVPSPLPPPDGGRETVPVSFFVTPKRDASGRLYMPDMVDDDGKRTQWNWFTGYMSAYSTTTQVTTWVVIILILLIVIGGGA